MTIQRYIFQFSLMAAALCGIAKSMGAQIYVNSLAYSKVSEFDFNGATINDSLITGVGQPFGITSAGGHIYVSTPYGGIGEYNFDGSVVNASLITGLDVPQGIAGNSTNLFVANYGSGTVGKYSLDGTLVNSSLVSGLINPIGIAVSGKNIYVTNNGKGTIAKYDLDGLLVNSSFAIAPDGRSIAIANGFMYVTWYAYGRIGVYDAITGATINDGLITGLVAPYGIAEANGHLFITNGYLNGRVSEYNIDGTLINESLVSGLTAPSALMVIQAVPESATFGWMGVIGVFCLIALKTRQRQVTTD